RRLEMATNQRPSLFGDRSYGNRRVGHGAKPTVLPGYAGNETGRRERKLRHRARTSQSRVWIEGAYQRAQGAVRSRSRVPGIPDATRWPPYTAGYARERLVALANTDADWPRRSGGREAKARTRSLRFSRRCDLARPSPGNKQSLFSPGPCRPWRSVD